MAVVMASSIAGALGCSANTGTPGGQGTDTVTASFGGKDAGSPKGDVKGADTKGADTLGDVAATDAKVDTKVDAAGAGQDSGADIEAGSVDDTLVEDVPIEDVTPADAGQEVVPSDTINFEIFFPPLDAGSKDTATSCGNGKCDNGETCTTCSKDCGACPETCGNGKCGLGESCATCSDDCGKCPVTCGDNKCEDPETCTTCPADCCMTGCNPLTSSECGATEQCYPGGSDTVCGAAGALTLKEPCTKASECAKGLLCVADVCRKICDVSGKTAGAACPSGAVCSELVDGGTQKPIGFNLGACFGGQSCNLVTNGGCPAGQNCSPLTVTSKECLNATGKKSNGQACTKDEDCLLGSLCIGPTANAQVCRQKCAAPNGTCPGAQVCKQVVFGQAQTPAPDSLGVCDLP